MGNKSLKESEENFRYLFEDSEVGKSMTLPSGEMNVNKAMCAMLGYTINELKNKTWPEITHIDDIAKAQQEINALLSGEKSSIRFTKRYIKKDGSILWGDVHSSVRRDADGKAQYFMTSIIDITDRIHTENDLRESERSKAILLANLPGLAYKRGPDWTMKFLSDGCYKLTGYKPEELIDNQNLTYNEIIAPEYKEHVFLIQAQAPQSTTPFRLEYEIIHASGERKWVFETGQILYDVNGKLEAFEGIIIDNSEKKQTEENMKRQNELMSSLLAVLPVGVFMVDADTGKPLIANNMAEKLLGRGVLPDANQKNLSEIYKAHKKGHFESYPTEEMPIIKGMKGKASHIDDMVVERPDGTEVLLEIYGTPILDEKGKPWASLVTFLDITKRTKVFEELDEALKFNQDIINNARNGIIVYDTALRYKVWNPYMEKLTGFSAKEVLGQRAEKIFPLLKETGVISNLENALEGKTFENSQFPFNLQETNKTGWVQDDNGPLYNRKGDIVGVLGIVQDISDRKISEDLLRESEERYRLLYTSMSQGLALHEIITDEKGNPIDYVFLDINDSYTRLVGVTKEMCIGKKIKEVMPKVEQYWIDIFGKVALTGEPNHYENYLETTGRYYSTYAYSPKNRHFAVLVSDITERKVLEEELRYMSYHDQLTKLYNRRFFESELHNLDTEENLPISIIMCDVNGLKLINDSFGHSAGDEVLIKTAEIIKKSCQTSDIVTRLGGDEFVIILPKTDTKEATIIINTIKKLLSKEKVFEISINVSFGIDTKRNSEQSIVEVLQNSENYMYRHKLYEHTSTKSNTINIIMKTLFEKSNRESLHSERVSDYCEKIAIEMNFDKDEINKIKIAGLVHDIGKIGIHEDILNKPGKLDENEWKEMKKHPEASWRILSSSVEYSEIARYIYEHHEKWDGSGYPKGLKGDEISIVARIIGIADAYDAMTSVRVYRKELSQSDAINEIKKYSGMQFDPMIAKVFVEKVLGTKW